MSACSLWDASTPGLVQLVNLTQLQDLAELVALQSPTMTLATLRFTALASGVSDLSVLLADIADENGNAISLDATGGQITVSNVPEPSAFWPAGLLLIGLVTRRRR
jgi:hypothetical protein